MNKGKQSLFSAKTVKCYKKPDVWGRDQIDCTAIERLAFLINSEWKHSAYWPIDEENKLLDKIQDNLNQEIKYAHKRLYDLIEAQSILDDVIRDCD